jgi:5'-3' exonuclease
MMSLDRLFEEFDPDEICVVWECPHVSWRHDIYPDYKGARKKRHLQKNAEEMEQYSDLLLKQIPDTKKALKGMGIRQLAVPMLEADDVLGRMVSTCPKDNDTQFIVVSTDRDMLQLVERHRCRVYNPLKGELYYQTKMGKLKGSRSGIIAPSPRTFLIWKAIQGDTSDSIKGVHGVGPVTIEKFFSKQKWEEEDRVARYIRKGRVGGKKGQTLLCSVKTVVTNVKLMDLRTTDGIRLTERRGSELAEAFLEAEYANPVLDSVFPSFLKFDGNVDPTPMLNFFRKRDCNLAFNPPQWGAWIKRYRTLYRRRRELSANNGTIEVGPWDIE